MKVHFSGTVSNIDQHLPYYELIVKTINSEGHEVLNNWLKDFQNSKSKKKKYSDEAWEDITTKNLKAIQDADVVIIEASLPSFSMGYQAALALNFKKPLLILFHSNYQHYIMDQNNSLKRAEVYHTEEELRRVLTSFLRDNDIDSKNLRFNMLLDRETYNYLYWESANSGRTKAQVIRDLIKERIQNSR